MRDDDFDALERGLRERLAMVEWHASAMRPPSERRARETSNAIRTLLGRALDTARELRAEGTPESTMSSEGIARGVLAWFVRYPYNELTFDEAQQATRDALQVISTIESLDVSPGARASVHEPIPGGDATRDPGARRRARTPRATRESGGAGWGILLVLLPLGAAYAYSKRA
jgi:hypothetical protein